MSNNIRLLHRFYTHDPCAGEFRIKGLKDFERSRLDRALRCTIHDAVSGSPVMVCGSPDFAEWVVAQLNAADHSNCPLHTTTARMSIAMSKILDPNNTDYTAVAWRNLLEIASVEFVSKAKCNQLSKDDKL
jgi:hypothetical protein